MNKPARASLRPRALQPFFLFAESGFAKAQTIMLAKAGRAHGMDKVRWSGALNSFERVRLAFNASRASICLGGNCRLALTEDNGKKTQKSCETPESDALFPYLLGFQSQVESDCHMINFLST